jgi:hypothetical protein
MDSNIKKTISVLVLAFLINFLFINQVKAVCPVCTIAVGVGVGLCRYLGIDDTISGTWIGGLIISLIAWTINWLDKKNIRFLFRKILVAIFYYAIVIVPLYSWNIMGHPQNKLFGIDKLLVGIIAGSIAFILSILFNDFLKRKNQGKVYFPFQKVVIPVLFLLITSLLFYLTC